MTAKPRSSLDVERARELIARRGSRLGEPLHVLAETGSTNDDAKAGARDGAPHGAVWLAETQSRGRGRQGRVWVSPPGENLLFSVVLRIACAPPRVPPLSLAVGLVVRDAVARALGDQGERVLVKWPNDVVVRARESDAFRKVAGILVESSVMGSRVDHVIVGVGVNVHTRDFPDALSSIATSIARESDHVPDRAELLADILATLDQDIETVAHRGLGHIRARLEAHDALRGCTVESEDGGLRGVASGVDADGHLLVRRAGDDVLVRIASGEVRLHLD